MIYDIQKASLMKRVSAWLLDAILLAIAITGFALLMSNIVDIEADYQSYSTIIEKFNVEASDNEWNLKVDFVAGTIGDVEFSSLTEEQQEYFSAMANELVKTDEYQKVCNFIFNKTLIIVSIAFLLAYVLLELIVPLIFKNGQTIGKKIFAIAVMRTDGVKISPVILFIRTILGKYTIEAMIPVYLLLMHHFGVGSLVTLAVLVLIPIFQIILLIVTKTNSCIHDILSSTVTVDLQSQMIFESLEEKNEYMLRIHSEDVKNAKYF